MISICIPVYDDMENGDFFLQRCLDSIKSQTYTDYEIVMTNRGNSPYNTNLGLTRATGGLIKILHQDDYFTHKHALKEIARAFKKDAQWVVTGCSNNMNPYYTGDIHLGNNKLGGPSVITLRKGKHVMFDDTLTWLFDCDFYKRMYDQYGEPTILPGNYVTIEEGEHQATNLIADTHKQHEVFLMRKKYEQI